MHQAFRMLLLPYSSARWREAFSLVESAALLTSVTPSARAEQGSLFSSTRLYSHALSAVMLTFTSEQICSACDCKAFTYNFSLKFPGRKTVSETQCGNTMQNPGTDESMDDSNEITDTLFQLAGQSFPLQLCLSKEA